MHITSQLTYIGIKLFQNNYEIKNKNNTVIRSKEIFVLWHIGGLARIKSTWFLVS